MEVDALDIDWHETAIALQERVTDLERVLRAVLFHVRTARDELAEFGAGAVVEDTER